MNNITRDNRFAFSSFTSVDATDEEIRKFALKDGDFLFNTRNSVELVGKCCLYESASDDIVLFNNNIMRIRFKDGIDAKFVLYAFSSNDVAEKLNELKCGTTNVAAVYYKDLKGLIIPVPPLPEQQRIVSILDEAFDGIARAKANADNNSATPAPSSKATSNPSSPSAARGG
jgi:type I restriction enzyme S subunit